MSVTLCVPNDMQVRNQDAIFLLRGVCSGAHEVAWQWLKVLTDALILPWLVLQLLFFLGVLANSMTATISGKLGLHIRSLLWNSAHLLRQHNCLTGKQHNPPASHLSCNPTFIIVFFLTRCETWFQLATDEKGDEAEEFFKSRTKASIARTVKQSIERVRINAQWVKSIKGEADLGNVIRALAHK